MSQNIKLEARLMNGTFYQAFIVIGKDRIYQCEDGNFVVEQCEYTEKGINYYSYVDSFDDLIIAINFTIKMRKRINKGLDIYTDEVNREYLRVTHDEKRI